jgi:hypothetical protein
VTEKHLQQYTNYIFWALTNPRFQRTILLAEHDHTKSLRMTKKLGNAQYIKSFFGGGPQIEYETDHQNKINSLNDLLTGENNDDIRDKQKYINYIKNLNIKKVTQTAIDKLQKGEIIDNYQQCIETLKDIQKIYFMINMKRK